MLRGQNHNSKAVTLTELLIAISLLGFVMLTLTTVDLFVRRQLRDSSIRANLLNEISPAIEHMTKEIKKAIGNTEIPEQRPVNLELIENNRAIRFYADLGSGEQPGDGRRGTGDDRWRAYRFTGTTGNNPYQIWYYSHYEGITSPSEILSRRIILFTPHLTGNCINITITACHDPDGSPNACGTLENPTVSLQTSIEMPLVSLR